MVRTMRGKTMPQPDAERAALDAQYNLRAAVPEHLTYFARYEGDSATLRARWPGKLRCRSPSTRPSTACSRR